MIITELLCTSRTDFVSAPDLPALVHWNFVHVILCIAQETPFLGQQIVSWFDTIKIRRKYEIRSKKTNPSVTVLLHHVSEQIRKESRLKRWAWKLRTNLDVNLGYLDVNLDYLDVNLGYLDVNLGYLEVNLGYLDVNLDVNLNVNPDYLEDVR